MYLSMPWEFTNDVVAIKYHRSDNSLCFSHGDTQSTVIYFLLKKIVTTLNDIMFIQDTLQNECYVQVLLK